MIQGLKYLARTFLFILTVFLTLTVIVGLLMKTGTVSLLVKNRIEQTFRENFNGRIDIWKLNINFPIEVELLNTKVYVEDELIPSFAADTLSLKLSYFNYFEGGFSGVIIRNVLLSGIDVKLEQDQEGRFNIERLFRSKESSPEKTDSTSFGEKIPQINCENLQIRNFNLNWKRYKIPKKDEPSVLDRLFVRTSNSSQTLRVQDLDFRCNVKTSPNLVSGLLKQFRFRLPQHNFRLAKTSAYFLFSNYQSEILALEAQTSRSILTFSASVRDFNIFSPFEISNLKKSPLFVQLNSKRLHKDDLNLLVPAFPKSVSEISLDVKTKGTLEDLAIEKFGIIMGKNRVSLTGNIQKIYDFNRLKADLDINKANFNLAQLSDLAFLEEPSALARIENISVSGKLFASRSDVKTNLNVASKVGNANIGAIISQLYSNKPVWQGKIQGEKINLAPILGNPSLKSRLNGLLVVSGQGKDRETLKGKATLQLDSSLIGGRWLNRLQSNLEIDPNKIKAEIALQSGSQKAKFNANAEFVGKKTMVYAFGETEHLNLKTVLLDDRFPSDLNLNFSLWGEGTKLDDISTRMELKLDSSSLRGVTIEGGTEAKFEIKQEAEGSSIEFASDIVAFNAFGDFDLNRLKVIGEYETRAAIKELSKNNIFSDRFSIPDILGIDSQELHVLSDSAFHFPDLKLVFDAHLKNPKKVAQILNVGDFEAEGTFRGVLQSSEQEMSLKSNAKLESLQFKEELAALELKYSINYKDSLINSESGKQSRFFNHIEFDADKLKLGGNIFYESNVVFDYREQSLYLNLRTSDKTTGGLLDLETNIAFLDELYDIRLKNFSFATSEVLWQLNPKANIRLSRKEISLQNVLFENYDQVVELNGLLKLSGYGEIDIRIKDLDLSELKNFMFDDEQKRLNGIVNLNGEIKGTLDQPNISADLFIDNSAYSVIDIGNIHLNSNYNDKELKVDLAINQDQARVDSLNLQPYNFNQLTLKGLVPIDLSFVTTQERLLKSKPLDVTLNSPNISPKVIEYFLPFFSNSHGAIPVKASIGGYFPNPDILINAELSDFVTTVEPSGVIYKINGNLEISDKKIVPRGVEFQDISGGKGYLTGAVFMDMFNITGLNLKATLRNFQLLNKSDSGNDDYWGIITGSSSDLALIGNLENPVLRGELYIDDATFSMTRANAGNNTQLAEATRYITFVPRVDPNQTENDTYGQNLNKTLYLFEENNSTNNEVYKQTFLDQLRIRNFILKNNRRLTFNMIFDRYSGEKLQTQIAELILNINKNGQEYIANGSIDMSSGKYTFATASFEIQPDASVNWNNVDIRKGNMENVYANRQLRITDRETNQIDDVTLSLYVGGTLDDPQVEMAYYLNQLSQPYSASETFGNVASNVDANAQLNVMTLLFANQWYIKPGSSTGFSGNTAISNVGLSAGAGLISAQLSRLASGISGLESVDLNISRDSEGAPVGVDLTVAVTVPGTDGRLKLITSGTTSKTELSSENSSYYSNTQRLEYQLTNKLVMEAYRTFGLNRNSVGYGFGDQVSEIWGLSMAYRENFRTWGELWDRIFHSNSDTSKSRVFQPELSEE